MVIHIRRHTRRLAWSQRLVRIPAILDFVNFAMDLADGAMEAGLLEDLKGGSARVRNMSGVRISY
jgi:hypothetical protein